MKKVILTTIIALLLLATIALAQNNSPNEKDFNEKIEIMNKYPDKFKAFYSLAYKMTAQEKDLFQKTVKKLEAEKKFNDLMNQEKALKEKVSKASNKQVQASDGRILTERQLYSEMLLDVKQKRIDTGVKYSVLKQEQAEEENKHYKNYQDLGQKEQELIKKYNAANSTGTIQNKDGRIMTEKQIIKEQLEEITKQRIDVAKKVVLLSEDKYFVGGAQQLCRRKQADDAQQSIIATAEPLASDNINQKEETSQSWGSAKQPVGNVSSTSQSWGSAKQPVGNVSSTSQSWGSAKQYTNDQQINNEVIAITPNSSKIISQDLINLANLNAKNKKASFGTAIGEYISGIPENVLDEAFRMSTTIESTGTFIDKYNNNLLKLLQKYGIPIKNVAILKSKPVPPEQPAQRTAQANNKPSGECFLPNGELDSDCFNRMIMPKIMKKVIEEIDKIPVVPPLLN